MCRKGLLQLDVQLGPWLLSSLLKSSLWISGSFLVVWFRAQKTGGKIYGYISHLVLREFQDFKLKPKARFDFACEKDHLGKAIVAQFQEWHSFKNPHWKWYLWSCPPCCHHLATLLNRLKQKTFPIIWQPCCKWLQGHIPSVPTYQIFPCQSG